MPTPIGQLQFRKYQKGKRITLKEAVFAKCYDCMGYYADGLSDCTCTDCPLYKWMPYKG